MEGANARKKVLFVDHSITVYRLIKKYLADSRYSLLRVDSSDVYDSIQAFEPDLVLMRESQPKHRGADIIAGLIEQGVKTPMVLVTSFDNDAIDDAQSRSGANDMLLLPTTKKSILSMLDKHTIGAICENTSNKMFEFEF